MFTSGYLLTTVIVRALWISVKVWAFPLVAAALFLIHFQIMNGAMGGEWQPQIKMRIRVAGVVAVFGCTLLGSFGLRKLAHRGGDEIDPEEVS